MAQIYVCRTCLEVIQTPSICVSLDGNTAKSKEIKSKLEACVPELTIAKVKNPIICGRCLISLNASYEFKRKCIATEEEIYNYLFDSNSDVLDLNLIAKECSKIKTYSYTKEIKAEEIKTELQTIVFKTEDNDISFKEEEKENDEEFLHTSIMEEKENDEDFLHTSITEENSSCVSNLNENDDISSSAISLHSDFTDLESFLVGEKQSSSLPSVQNETEQQLPVLPECSVALTRIFDDALKDVSVIDSEASDNYQNDIATKDGEHLKSSHKKSAKNSNTNFCYVCYPNEANTSQPMIIKKRLKVSDDEKCYQCGICGYASMFKLKIHMRIHTGEKPHKCDVCGFATAYANHLKVHKKTHLKNKSHNCAYCEYRAHSFMDLSSHMNNHPGMKAYKCEQCEYSTNNLADLKCHQRSHNKKLYECATCEFKSCCRSTFISHLKVHSKGKPYRCTKCQFSTIYSFSLRYHLKMHNSGKDVN